MKVMKEKFVGLDVRDMSVSDLLEACTYCNSWVNPYCEEVCRRAGNYEDYAVNAMDASIAAAEKYNSILF